MEKSVAWWDKLGTPQYSGEMVIRANRNIVSFDPYITENLANIYSAWMERLVADDWTLDPAVFDYKTHWHPSQYMKGHLAEDWEFSDREFIGRKYRRQTAGSSSLETWYSISTVCAAWVETLTNRVFLLPRGFKT